jgi:hypothetical protein
MMNKTYNRLLNLVTETDVMKSLDDLTIRPTLTSAQKRHRADVEADVARIAAGKKQQKYAEKKRKAEEAAK